MVAEETSGFTQVMETVAEFFELLAAAVLVLGLVWALVLAWQAYRRSGNGKDAYLTVRQAFGGAILLSLEFLVAGDLIRTVAVAPTLENALTLGIIVLIRTLLSFSIQVEIEGALPWRRALVSGATVARDAQRKASGDPQSGSS